MAERATAAAESAHAAASEQVEQHKAAASQSLDAFAQAVRKASDELSEQDHTTAARLIKEAAGGLESLSRSLANQSLEDMIGTLREFGRRNPAALAGGAALAGLALGRFARSSRTGGDGGATNQGRQPHSHSQPQAAEGGLHGTGSPPAGEFPATRAGVAPSPQPTSQPRRGSQPQEGGARRSGGSHE